MRRAEVTRFEVFAVSDGPEQAWETGSFKTSAAHCGGFSSTASTALRFAMFENGNRPQAVRAVKPGVFELDINRGAAKPAATAA